MLWTVSFTSLSIVVVACTVCILWDDIRENILEFLGMSILIFGCAARAKFVMETHYVDPSWLVVHVGMATYAIGSAVRVIAHKMREMRYPPVVRFDAWLARKRIKRDIAVAIEQQRRGSPATLSFGAWLARQIRHKDR